MGGLWLDYFNHVFHTFLGLDSVIYLAVTILPVFIDDILSFVSKTNEAFTSLERHVKWLMKMFVLGWSIPLQHKKKY